MSSPAISIRSLGKRYRVNHAAERAPYRTLRDSLTRAATAPWRRLRGQTNGASEEFWALKDVEFDVQPGEVVGIIGRNGAGKSTLLKILSRITSPTTGEVTINGRVGSLLEVGTGFHPELTGRENIYMNGSILGMSRREISRKFDEIVDFSGIDAFIDTPVKRYSSGMYVRLAFAVAAHLEPEVLLVDEVLAVGDVEFQKKCVGRMKEISVDGRTIIFVSHNMAAASNLCSSGIYFENGEIAYLGDVVRTLERYTASLVAQSGGTVELDKHPARAKGSIPLLSCIQFQNAAGEVTRSIPCGSQLTIVLKFAPRRALDRPQFGIGFDDALGQRVFSVGTFLSKSELPALNTPRTVYCRIDSVDVAPGTYTLSISAGTTGHYLIDALHNAVSIEVTQADFYGNGRTPPGGLGQLMVRSEWSVG